MSRADISGRLKDSGRAISGSRTRMQSALVMGEMAMALVLLAGAGLMCRTLVQLWKVDPGFDPRNVTYFEVTPPPSLVNQSPDAILAALRQVNAALQACRELRLFPCMMARFLWKATLRRCFCSRARAAQAAN